MSSGIEAYKEIKTSYPTYLIIGGPQIFAIPDYDKALEEAKDSLKKAPSDAPCGKEFPVNWILSDISENTYQRSKYTHPEYIDATVSAKAVPKKRVIRFGFNSITAKKNIPLQQD